MNKFLTLSILLFCSLVATAQDKEVEIDIRNEYAREAFSKISQETDMKFVYAEKNVSRSARVSLTFKDGKRLSDVLDSLCRQLNLKYEIKGNLILLSPERGRLYSLRVCIRDELKEPMQMARCELKPIGLYSVTDAGGCLNMDDIPAGHWILHVSYIGYITIEKEIDIDKDMELNLEMQPTSLALEDVVVTARQKISGASTSTVVGRQAIDHLQASSLADIMQLLPGQVMGNKDLTSQSNLQLRTLVNNNTSAFGSSIVVDGVPMSNNGAVSQGQFSSTAFTGTDLRQISSDDIEQVEIVRGIPSAEYGDLSSGLVVVKSKAGVTPWQAKAKINPESMNFSLGKGLSLGKAGILNVNADYAQAWGDPRQKTRSFHRYTAAIGYSFDITRKWHTDTKLRFMQARDWSGNDPDAIDDGTSSESRITTWSLSHRGRINVNRPFARTVTYTAGLSLTGNYSSNTSYISNSTGLLPIITSMETGYHSVPWMTTSYLATGRTESKPGNVFIKVNDAFHFDLGNTKQSFKTGIEYHYDWNNGRGYYNLDDALPYRPNSDGRPRPFSDIPGLHQISAYAEDSFLWQLNEINDFRINFGLRFTSMQPFSDVATASLSPRLNVSFRIVPWLSIRGGIGLNSKTPGLNYLYPDKKYTDRVAANYMPQDNPAAQLLMYHTQVYDVKMSRDLKNATTTKMELGVDIKLPWGGMLELLAYQDKTPNGFGSATEYFTYFSDIFIPGHGIIVSPEGSSVDFSNPYRHDIVFSTTGKIGNTNSTLNRGIEFDFNFGQIRPINTTLFFSGAYQETKTWSTDIVTSSPRNALLPSDYTSYTLTPFKVIYPSGLDYNKYRRFLNTLRIVTAIPVLKMVASFTAQVIWHDWNRSFVANKKPVGWIDTNLYRHEITPEMMNGYLGMDGEYYKTKPDGLHSIQISDLSTSVTDNIPSKNPVTWNLSARLTKEFGKFGGLSIHVNNCLYYEPYLKNNVSNTLTQRNTGSFSFGAELFINL